nr:hypothetical protein L203_04659 [Cryptococcus depauperatus CBS 7841]
MGGKLRCTPEGPCPCLEDRGPADGIGLAERLLSQLVLLAGRLFDSWKMLAGLVRDLAAFSITTAIILDGAHQINPNVPCPRPILLMSHSTTVLTVLEYKKSSVGSKQFLQYPMFPFNTLSWPVVGYEIGFVGRYVWNENNGMSGERSNINNVDARTQHCGSSFQLSNGFENMSSYLS